MVELDSLQDLPTFGSAMGGPISGPENYTLSCVPFQILHKLANGPSLTLPLSLFEVDVVL